MRQAGADLAGNILESDQRVVPAQRVTRTDALTAPVARPVFMALPDGFCKYGEQVVLVQHTPARLRFFLGALVKVSGICVSVSEILELSAEFACHVVDPVDRALFARSMPGVNYC